MTSAAIRQSFLDFFVKKSHRIINSAPVVPYNDPTLLFINAGMNQFKDVFLGTGSRDYTRVANTQKCIRVSGKHNDLEEVGVDTYHHTLFEMLGNWSFGDYYKTEAIGWAWELLTQVWKLDVTRLYATVYRTDDEAYELWRKYLPENHIQRFDEKDNFWEMGATGPCGPCSEIHYDRTLDLSGGPLVNAGSPDVIEIWNLVFIQYNRKSDGTLEPLANKFVDTGMGFERICSILQDVCSNYDTDVFVPLLNKVAELSQKEYGKDDKMDIAMRVLADHVRTLSFAIADGALPGNEGRNYVLRRILRRGLRYARVLGFHQPIMYKLVQILVDTMGSYFTELVKNQKQIEMVIKGEEESFLQTMEKGIEQIDSIINGLQINGLDTIKGEDAFLLYDTFGFPLDLTELIARENNIKVDVAGFELKMAEQKERSRAARKQISQEINLPTISDKTEFIGYDKFEVESTVLFARDNMLVLAETPFYVEMGGQVGDIGIVTFQYSGSFDIKNVKKSANAVFHIIDTDIPDFDISKYCKIGDKAFVKINQDYRYGIMRHHTATHLLHEALRQVLGNHIQQAGSLVTSSYLRFDFNHFEKVQPEQIKQIEDIVNNAILAQLPVVTTVQNIEEAQKNPKIKMFFGDKYGDVVRTVAVGDFAIELCGGTHCNNAVEICYFRITSESSVAAGVRRIEAVAGKYAFNYVENVEKQLHEKVAEIDDLKSHIKRYEKVAEKMKQAEIANSLVSMVSARKINDIRLFVTKIDAESLDFLRTAAEKIREHFGTNAICLLAAVIEDKVQLACAVTDDLTKKCPAGKLVGEAAKLLGGGGGGKPHLATAGGKDAAKLDELLDTKFHEIVENAI